MSASIHFMDTHKLSLVKSYFSSVDSMFLSEFMYGTMPRWFNHLWGLFCSVLFQIFVFLEKFIDRMVDSDFTAIHSLEEDELDCESDKILESDEIRERKDFDEKGVERESSVFAQSKYQYISVGDAFGFIEKPEAKNFTIQEMFTNSGEELQFGLIRKEEVEKSYDHSSICKDNVLCFSFFKDGNDKRGSILQLEERPVGSTNPEQVSHTLHQEHVPITKTEDFDEKENVDSFCCGEILRQKKDASQVDDEGFSDKGTYNLDDICYEIQLLPENQFLALNSVQRSDSMGDESFNTSDESSCDKHLNGFLTSDQFAETDREENDDMGFIELETPLQNLSPNDTYNMTCDRLEETDTKCGEKELVGDLQEYHDQNSSPVSWDSDSDEEDEFDILHEHENLVRQMRNSRIIGLPTISEDCESPKIVEDLKPLRLDKKIEYKDPMEEIQKFDKSYAEKMRKLDILNYQTLNAISFLQLKDSDVFMSSKKSSISIMKTFALPSFLANNQRKIFADPALKSIVEMNTDLEIVYVGQVCLSWEILCWQYGEAKELQEHDPHGYHSYNRIAGEYQQFQVLLQRFMEDEPFQGPRVQNYVRKRCMLRSFLQIPSIRDDCLKEKQGGLEREKDVISVVKLAKIIKETMQVFWEFLHADKAEANLALKSVPGTQMDPAEMELLMNVRSDLQKKERKLKDVQRSGNCLLKKFQKQQEGRLSHSLFTSLVDIKLVSRVLSLPRLRRDYLVWCQKKLSNINVTGRKVSVEPSFSLFPC